MTSRTLTFVLLVLAAPAAACTAQGGVSDGSVNILPPPPPPHEPDASAAGAAGDDEAGAGADAGTDADAGRAVATAPAFQGSPLCNVSPASPCQPDEPATAQGCHQAPDGGAYDPRGDYFAPLACHVMATSASAVAPVCTPAGSAPVGASCGRPTDCAPTSECVGSGTCQRYCCGGEVDCLGDHFCDVQPVVGGTWPKVPVCMPIHTCDLDGEWADASGCAPNETCAVVRDDGATSCVATGSAKAGESCDIDHCASGLVCLGVPGARHCFELCRTVGSDCPTGQACKGGLPLFPNPLIGVCQ